MKVFSVSIEHLLDQDYKELSAVEDDTIVSLIGGAAQDIGWLLELCFLACRAEREFCGFARLLSHSLAFAMESRTSMWS
jgi:hypothetical protein